MNAANFANMGWVAVRRGVSVFVATGGTGSVVNARPMAPHTIPIIFRLWWVAMKRFVEGVAPAAPVETLASPLGAEAPAPQPEAETL